VLGVIGGIFAARHWRGWAFDATRQGVVAALEHSGLTDEQRSAILAEVDALGDRFKSGDIPVRSMMDVMERVAQSPILPVAAVIAAQRRYIEPSTLAPEEKAQAELALQRLARGYHERKISLEALEDALDEIVVRTGEHNWHMREPSSVSDKDLRQLIEEAAAAADEAGIPVEPFTIDIAAELRQAIDRALKGAPAPEGGGG
jgi:hypothetical protein